MMGTFPTPAALGFKTLVPFMNQIATLPLVVSRHRTSLLPSPLKSPVPTIDQVVATFPTPAVLGFKTVVPFISQIATFPPVSRQAMSLLPSALKSWELTIVSVRRPILPVCNSVNHSAPSAPILMAMGPLLTVGIGNSVITPAVVMRPMLLLFTNHSAPSGPVVMPDGALLVPGIGNSVTTPAVVMRPMLLVLGGASGLVNHSAPSGPVVMTSGPPPGGSGNSVTTPKVVMRP